MADLSVGLIGCGRIAQLVHLGLLTRMPGVRLTAVADADVDHRARASARAPDAEAYEDYRELLDAAPVDAVVVCLPSGLHADAAVAAFRAGLHVYLEKPLATRAGDAREVLNAWRASGRVGMMGLNNRFHPLFAEARRRIAEGALGRVVAARSVVCSPTRTLPDWKRARESGGGALLDLASHHADLLPHLLGREVRDVHAAVWSVRTEDDNGALTLRFDDGLVAQLFVSLTSAQTGAVEVFGDAGRLFVDRRLGRIEITPARVGSSRRARLGRAANRLGRVPADVWRTFRPGADPSYAGALADFARAAREGGDPGVDLEAGFRSLGVVLAAEASARTGGWVPVETP